MKPYEIQALAEATYSKLDGPSDECVEEIASTIRVALHWDKGDATFERPAMKLAMPGSKVSFGGNVVYCNLHRTYKQNLRACLVALAYVSGESINDILKSDGIKTEQYRSS